MEIFWLVFQWRDKIFNILHLRLIKWNDTEAMLIGKSNSQGLWKYILPSFLVLYIYAYLSQPGRRCSRGQSVTYTSPQYLATEGLKMFFKCQLLEKQKPIFFYIPCSVLKYVHKFFSIPPINRWSLILLPLRVGGIVTPFWGKEPGRSSSVSFPRLRPRRHQGALLAPSFGSLTPGDTSSHVPRILKSNAERSAGPGTKASCQQPVRKWSPATVLRASHGPAPNRPSGDCSLADSLTTMLWHPESEQPC